MNDLRDQLQGIYDEYGYLSGELLATVAKPRNHPLHGRIYTKNRDDAAHAFYVDQAERLIRSVKINYREREDGTYDKVRFFHPVRADAPGVYDPLDVIVENEVAMTVLLRTAEREWKLMRAKYNHLSEFWEMVKQDVA